MQDIGRELEKTSKENNCSVFNALLILLKEKEKPDVCALQPKPTPKPSR